MQESGNRSPMRIVEIKGTKFEVDLREATIVESLRIGDRVSVLLKRYGGDYEVKHGVVVGFEPFEKLPTVLIAYLQADFYGGEIKILAWNEATKDTKIVKSVDDVLFSKEEALQKLDRQIDEAERKLGEARQNKAYFLKHFGAYWKDAVEMEQVPKEE